MSIYEWKDVYLAEAELNVEDLYWFGFFTLILILFLVDYLYSPSTLSAGLIYLLLSFISGIFFLGAATTDNQLFGYVFYGDEISPFRTLLDIAVGAVMGTILVAGLLGFAIVYNPSPFALAPSASLINNLILLLIVGFLGVEAEEMFRTSTLLPSLLRYTANETFVLGLYAGIIIFSIVLLFFLLQFYGITVFFIVALLLSVDVGIAHYYNPRKGVEVHPVFQHAQGILFTSLIFMMLHVLAYGNGSYTTNLQSYIAAFVFAVVMDTANALLGSAIASRIAHSINNSVLAATALGLPLYYAGLVVVIYALFILTVGSVFKHEGFRDLIFRAPAINAIRG